MDSKGLVLQGQGCLCKMPHASGSQAQQVEVLKYFPGLGLYSCFPSYLQSIFMLRAILGSKIITPQHPQGLSLGTAG